LNNIVIENDSVTHERVDDIPLIMGLMQKLHLPEILNRHLGSHGNHQGLSNGWLATLWLATLWLAYILSESDHGKYTVQGWVDAVVDGKQPLQPIWNERVLVICSLSRAQRQEKRL